ncbi:MAG: hypothetical protein JOZ16_18370 [Methylobacteriaceae bacterium]|nr:hypothetical protein [Methylobacteriaceae bacterium]
MRRNWIAILLFALALIGRVLLPVGAEARAADPLADAPICTHVGSMPPPGDAGGGLPAHSDACDAFCCHVASAFAAPTGAILAVEHSWRPAEWHPVELRDASPRSATSHQPRGPPTLS